MTGMILCFIASNHANTIPQVIDAEVGRKKKRNKRDEADRSAIGSSTVIGIEVEDVEPSKSVSFKAGSSSDKLIKV